jgi:hypothetical protein
MSEKNVKNVKLIREEMDLLEEAKKMVKLTEEGAIKLAPYTYKNVPTLFKTVLNESEKDYKEIYNRMLDQIEAMNQGDISRDKATENIGQYLFKKLVKPNI